jgi:hypothetical protein
MHQMEKTMNIIEKQTALTKSLYEINSNTLKALFELQKNNVSAYIETNRTFGEKLPEIKSVETLMGVQKEYGTALWSNAKGAFQAQNDIVKEALTEAKSAVTHAYGQEQVEQAPVVAKKAKAKPKAKAKTKAKAKAKTAAA